MGIGRGDDVLCCWAPGWTCCGSFRRSGESPRFGRPGPAAWLLAARWRPLTVRAAPRCGRRPAARPGGQTAAAASSPAGNLPWAAYGVRGRPAAHDAPALASMAVDDAAAAAAAVPLAKAAPLRPLGRSAWPRSACSGPSAGGAGGLPAGLAWTQWNRFLRPLDDVPPFSLHQVPRLRPATSRFPTAASWKIRATVDPATPVEQLELVLESAHGREPPLPMFPEARRRLAGGAGQGGRAGRLLRPRPIVPAARSTTSTSSPCRSIEGCAAAASCSPSMPSGPPMKGRCPTRASAACPAPRCRSSSAATGRCAAASTLAVARAGPGKPAVFRR